jgi:hypothetical protein
VAPEARKSEDVPLLFSVSTFVSYLSDNPPDASGPAERSSESAFEIAAQKAPPGRRKYKGAVYEKGEDGLWHLQHES